MNKTLENVIGILDASGAGYEAFQLRQLWEAQETAIIKAHQSLAMVGFPEKNGKYDKNGEWNFTKMTENGNPEDAKLVKKAFQILSDQLNEA
jgi:hypothetical protein